VLTGAYSLGVRPRYAFAAMALAVVVALAARAGLDSKPEHRPDALPAPLLGLSNDGGTRSLAKIAPVSLRPDRCTGAEPGGVEARRRNDALCSRS
jgi:hypothetical protein